MYCISVGRSEDAEDIRRTEAAYKLRAEPVMHIRRRKTSFGRTVVYNMEAVAMD